MAPIYLRANCYESPGEWEAACSVDRVILTSWPILTRPGTDHLIGRLLSGAKPKSVDLAALPPHFSKDGFRKIQEMGGFEKFLPGFKEFPGCFKRCIPYFLASIVYHLPTLQEWFPKPHLLWEIPLFSVFGSQTTSKLMELRSKVLVRRQRCPDCFMTGSGIPSEVAYMCRVSDTSQDFDVAAVSREERLQKWRKPAPQAGPGAIMAAQACHGGMTEVGRRFQLEVQEDMQKMRDELRELKQKFEAFESSSGNGRAGENLAASNAQKRKSGDGLEGNHGTESEPAAKKNEKVQDRRVGGGK
eukprot:132654-Hanusia_phi.AAC.3